MLDARRSRRWPGRVIFFFASAAASSAYLTVSETFPLEIRALAIAFFYAVGTGIGGVAGPWLFGALIDTGSRIERVRRLSARRGADGRRRVDRGAFLRAGRAQAARGGGAAAGIRGLAYSSNVAFIQ